MPFAPRLRAIFSSTPRPLPATELLSRIKAGDKISVAQPAGGNGGKDRADLGANGMAMFVLTPGEQLDVVTAGDRTELREGQQLIGLQG